MIATGVEVCPETYKQIEIPHALAGLGIKGWQHAATFVFQYAHRRYLSQL